MTTTTNLGLKKPENSDYVDVSVLNENMDKLDEAVPAAAGNALKESGTKGTPADNDGVVIVDSADSSKIKRVLWSKIKALFAPSAHASQHGASGNDPITPVAIGAVSKDGDTMTGDLILIRSGYPAMKMKDSSAGSGGRFLHSNHATLLESRDTDTDADRRYLAIYDQTKESGVKDALKLADVSNGSYRFYTLLHEGNLSDLSIAKIATGSYVGTGTYGPDNKNSLTFPFNPKFVAIWMDNATVGPLFVFISEKSNYTLIRSSGGSYSRNCSFDGNTLSWWSGDGSYGTGDKEIQANSSGVTYNYVALG